LEYKIIDTYLMNNLKENNMIWLNQLKNAGCTQDELEYIKNGNEIIFNQKRMLHIIKSIRGIK